MKARYTFVLREWIWEQRQYSGSRKEKFKRKERVFGLTTNLFLAAVMMIMVFRFPSIFTDYTPELDGFLAFLIGACTVGAAVFERWRESNAREELSRKYDDMAQTFLRAETALGMVLENEASTPEHQSQAGDIVHKLCVEALSENSGWLILHRSREGKFLEGG